MFNEHEQTSEEQRLPAELAALERELKRLEPARLRIDRDQLMFEAGRASAGALAAPVSPADGRRASARLWQAATATMTAASIALAVLLARQSQPTSEVQSASRSMADLGPAPRNVVRPVFVAYTDSEMRAELPSWLSPGPPTRGYLATRDVALAFGLNALESRFGRQPSEAVDGSPAGPVTSRELLNELLPNDAPTLNDRI